ncbi:iron chelate uptake ABC transporter family permease subunit [Nocardiopsis sp. CC223A]|uniref:FecCD family ABC transporter permease n=1 Tax=Nocardiopsis sp. CC223A TaxID=3044051 RepID=UPI00278C097E|nr:iron ABC transporter permease [Nocardiopsis sp. CC223A]
MTATLSPSPSPAPARSPLRWLPRPRPRPRVAVAVLGTLLVLVLTTLAALSLGDRATPPGELWQALRGHGAENTLYAVHEVRLPRIVLALAVGAAFGVAGGIGQSVLRNPLASPDVLGVSAGASAAAVGVIAVGSLGGPIGLVPIPVAALAGGLGAAGLIALLARDGAVRGRRLLLVGIGLSAALTGVTQYLLTLIDVHDAQRSAVWLTGSLNARGWAEAAPVLAGCALLIPAALALAHTNRALLFGDDVATGWGVRTGRARGTLLAVAVCLAALATSAGGPIAFVALVSGQVARRLARVPDIPPLLSALTGALIVLAADTAARTALPVQLPVGVLTALVGAPYLLYLLQRRRGTRGAA